MTVCTVLAFTGIAMARCHADPTTVSTNLPPLLPLDQLLSTNVTLPLASTNPPSLSLETPSLNSGGPKLVSPDEQAMLETNLQSQLAMPPTSHPPGIYLSSPYAMEVKVPDAVDADMVHAPSGNLHFDTPVHSPGLDLKQQDR